MTLVTLALVLPSDSRLLAVLSVPLGLPLILAIGGAIDEAHGTTRQADAGQPRAAAEGVIRAPPVAIYLTGAAVSGWAAAWQARTGDIATALAMLALAGALGWRAWATSHRRRTDGVRASNTHDDVSRLK